MVYFAAPLLTVAAIVDGVIATFRPYIPGLWPRREHLIVAGAGRVARAFIRELRKNYPRVPVVVVDRNPETDMLVKQTNLVLRDRGIWVHIGDLYDETMLERLHLQHAKGVLLLTGDEVANTEAASQIYDYFERVQKKPPPLRVRMDDLHLMRYANERFGTNPNLPCINIHTDTASRILNLKHMHEGMDVDIYWPGQWHKLSGVHSTKGMQ